MQKRIFFSLSLIKDIYPAFPTHFIWQNPLYMTAQDNTDYILNWDGVYVQTFGLVLKGHICTCLFYKNTIPPPPRFCTLWWFCYSNTFKATA